MKQPFKKLLRFGFTLLAILLLLTNCEKENQEEPVQIENQEPTFTLKHFSKKDFEKNTKLISRLKEFKDKLSKNKASKYASKMVYNEEYDFTIYTDSATYIEYSDYHSYTFPLVQDADEKITNVLFELNEQGEYDAYLVKYDYSANEFKTQELSSLSLKTSMKPIDLAFNSLFARTMSYYRCIFTYEWTKTGTKFTKGDSNTIEDEYSYVLTAIDCETVYYDNGDTKTYINADNTATVTISGTTYGGSSGGSKTSPIPSPFSKEELIQIDIVKNELNLSYAERLWIDEPINGMTAFQLYDFLKNNAFSNEAITEANARLYMEMLDKPTTNTITITWKPNSGIYLNRESLKYTKTAEYRGMLFFNLENGLILISSGQKELKTTKDTAWNSEVNQDGFHYIYSRDTKRLYEYKVPPANYPDADIDFLLDAFWTGVSTTARYATPLEDAIILLDGKDFDGVEQNRVYTAGFMIVGFIPGGKIMKPVSKVVKNSDVALAGWKVLTKIGDETVALSFKVVNGLVEFGSRSKLASIIKTTSLEEAHHIIPWNKLGEKPIQEAAYAGFHMNAEINGRALQKYSALIGEGIHGNHPAYDKFVQKRLDDFTNTTSVTPENALEFLNESLIPELNNLIDDAIDSGMNLNTFFRDVINPLYGID